MCERTEITELAFQTFYSTNMLQTDHGKESINAIL